MRKPHVVLTVAERDYRENGGRVGLLDIVENAVKDRRVISFDKEKRDYLSVNTKATSLGIITEKSLEDNLAHFRKEIKAFKEKNKINYSTRDPAQQRGLRGGKKSCPEAGDACFCFRKRCCRRCL